MRDVAEAEHGWTTVPSAVDVPRIVRIVRPARDGQGPAASIRSWLGRAGTGAPARKMMCSQSADGGPTG